MTDNVIIIPTRLEARRLPNKPLKKIKSKEMILHVYEAAKKANVGDVIVASPNEQINNLINLIMEFVLLQIQITKQEQIEFLKFMTNF